MGELWNLSLTQARRGERVLYGASVRFYDLDTGAPKTVYTDIGLSAPHPPKVIVDNDGSFPAIYIPYGDYRMVCREENNATWFDVGVGHQAPTMSGGGSTYIVPTGYIDVTLAGERTDWVRLNGRTIGSASSGATERQNSDCEALFTHLWNLNLPSAIVSPSRGSSAASDWASNKQISLPDLRGAVLLGSDTMGAPAANRLTGVPVVYGTISAVGSLIGESRHVMTEQEMFPHQHGGATGSGGAHPHTYTAPNSFVQAPAGSSNTIPNSFGLSDTSTAPPHSHTIPLQGGGQPSNITQLSYVVTYIIKL